MSGSSDIPAQILASAPPLPLSSTQWQDVVKALGLSRRQARVAELALRDLCNKQIAVVMGISEKTVETHLERAGRRAGGSGRMQLAMRVLEVALTLYGGRGR